MNPRRAVFLTGRREVRERLRSRAFRVGLLVQILIVAGIAIVSAVTSDDGPSTTKLGVSGQGSEVIAVAAKAQGRAFDTRVELTRYADPASAHEAVANGDVDLALVNERLVTTTDSDTQDVALVQSAAAGVRSTQELRSQGLSATEIAQALKPPPLGVTEVGSGDQGKGLAFIGVLLLYIAILTFGYAVTAGVIEEKQSRVIELLLSSIKARELLAGKVLGIGVVGVLQIVLVGGVGLAVALGSGELDLPSSTATTAVLVAVYFVLGYLFYACAFAVAGSLVSRQEDAQSTTTPMMLLLVGSYIASFSVIESPRGTLATVLTLLPPFAPMTVPARAAQDALPAWELALSLVLMVLGILVLIRLAGRVYERSVLRVGAPLKLSSVLRLARG